MCGITGIHHFNSSKIAQEEEILAMTEQLLHRGPDGRGMYVSVDGKVALGSTRLSITDLSAGGDMPMEVARSDSPHKLWITFNGQIYNHSEMREGLERMGYHFETRTDTEVLLKSYLAYGIDCVKLFNGVFAFVIWDEKERTLFAARDHMGVRPFYYAILNGSFYFGSEIKALLRHPEVPKELDVKNIAHYLTFASVPAPETLFANIKKLPAAARIVIREGSVREEIYWNPLEVRSIARTETDYVDAVLSLVKDSVALQTRADVPMGSFLSGGVDSSTLSALALHRLGSSFTTLSVGWKKHADQNEFEYSRLIARALGVSNHEIVLDTDTHLEEFLDRFPMLADDPIGNETCVPFYWLSKAARNMGIKTVLVGDGSDEIFNGYKIYQRVYDLHRRWGNVLERLPLRPRTAIIRILESSLRKYGHKEHEFALRLKNGQEPFWGWAIFFDDQDKGSLLSPEYRSKQDWTSYHIIKNCYDEIDSMQPNADLLKRITYLETRHRMSEFVLMAADKMGMANSVETRVPYLDRRLVELALDIPASLKMRNGVQEYVLKKAVGHLIPMDIIERNKKGFGLPAYHWFFRPRTNAERRMINIILHSKMRHAGVLDYHEVEKLLYEHQKGIKNNHYKLWILLTLSLWYDYWF